MAKTWKCRECGMDLRGAAQLRIGEEYVPRTPKGDTSHGLCLTCADKQMAKFRTPTLHEFVPAYVRKARETVRPPSKMTQLTTRIAQLEALLEALTDPDSPPVTNNGNGESVRSPFAADR